MTVKHLLAEDDDVGANDAPSILSILPIIYATMWVTRFIHSMIAYRLLTLYNLSYIYKIVTQVLVVLSNLSYA